MMMNSSCVAGCLDVQAPVKVSFVKLYKWPEADAEFLRRASMKAKGETGRSPFNSERSVYHESFASRQRYLRSYTFSKKETVAEKTRKWLKEKQKVKSKSKHGSGSDSCSFLEGIFNSLLSCVHADVRRS